MFLFEYYEYIGLICAVKLAGEKKGYLTFIVAVASKERKITKRKGAVDNYSQRVREII